MTVGAAGVREGYLEREGEGGREGGGREKTRQFIPNHIDCYCDMGSQPGGCHTPQVQ